MPQSLGEGDKDKGVNFYGIYLHFWTLLKFCKVYVLQKTYTMCWKDHCILKKSMVDVLFQLVVLFKQFFLKIL